MAITINEFITECENYEYSHDFYEATKDCLSLRLQMKYLENQSYLIEQAEMFDNSNIFTEADEGSDNQSNGDDNEGKTNASVLDKIKTGAKLTLNTLKNLFIRLWNFIKYIFRKLSDAFPKFGNWINNIISLEKTELDDDWFTVLGRALRNVDENTSDDTVVKVPVPKKVKFRRVNVKKASINNTNTNNNGGDNDITNNDSNNNQSPTKTDDQSQSNTSTTSSTTSTPSTDDNSQQDQVVEVTLGELKAALSAVLTNPVDISLMVLNNDENNVRSEKITRNVLRDIIAPEYLNNISNMNWAEARIAIFKYLKNLKAVHGSVVELHLPGNAPHIVNDSELSKLKTIFKIISDRFDNPDKYKNDDYKNKQQKIKYRNDNDDIGNTFKGVLERRGPKYVLFTLNQLLGDSKDQKVNVSLYMDSFTYLSNECNMISKSAEKYQKSATDMVTNYTAQEKNENKKPNRAANREELQSIIEKKELFTSINRIMLYINCAAANTMNIYKGFGTLMKIFNDSYNNLVNSLNS